MANKEKKKITLSDRGGKLYVAFAIFSFVYLICWLALPLSLVKDESKLGYYMGPGFALLIIFLIIGLVYYGAYVRWAIDYRMRRIDKIVKSKAEPFYKLLDWKSLRTYIVEKRYKENEHDFFEYYLRKRNHFVMYNYFMEDYYEDMNEMFGEYYDEFASFKRVSQFYPMNDMVLFIQKDVVLADDIKLLNKINAYFIARDDMSTSSIWGLASNVAFATALKSLTGVNVTPSSLNNGYITMAYVVLFDSTNHKLYYTEPLRKISRYTSMHNRFKKMIEKLK